MRKKRPVSKPPAHASEGPVSLAPGPRASGRPVELSSPWLVVQRMHSSSSPRYSLGSAGSMRPSLFTSREVSILPFLLRSLQFATSFAILVIEGCPPNARLPTNRSPLKSTAVREGELSFCCTSCAGPSGCLFLRFSHCGRLSIAQHPFLPSHCCLPPVGSAEQVT